MIKGVCFTEITWGGKKHPISKDSQPYKHFSRLNTSLLKLIKPLDLNIINRVIIPSKSAKAPIAPLVASIKKLTMDSPVITNIRTLLFTGESPTILKELNDILSSMLLLKPRNIEIKAWLASEDDKNLGICFHINDRQNNYLLLSIFVPLGITIEKREVLY